VFEAAESSVKEIENAEHLLGTFLGLALVAVAVGAGGAYYIYVQMKGAPARSFVEAFPRLHRAVYNKWYVDEIYEETAIGAVDSLAEFGAWGDKWIVDGIIAKLSAFIVRGAGSLLRLLQTGRIQAYAAVMVVGLALVGWFLVAPHASAKVLSDHAAGAYSVTATPGLGYSYRWDEDGDGKWDSDSFGEKASVSFDLERDKSRTVALQVKNAFGQTTYSTFELKRPKEDRSGPGNTVIDVEQGPGGQLRGTPRAPGQPGQPARPAPAIMPGAKLPAGHPSIPQGQ
jgi:NADH-quinone oxidoreductase subunit L